LEQARDPLAFRTLGVADVDLFAPRLNFVFGEAILLGSVAVISLARLRPEFYGQPPEPEALERRAIIEALHELSHTLGLGHCPRAHCVMRFSNCIEHTDQKGFAFCERCAEVIHGALRAA
jgi:archaemetzincin